MFEACKPNHSLPQALYNDPEVYAFDLEAIFARHWFQAGLVCELPSPGHWLSILIGASPVIVTRDRDGTIKAFHNSCRHRGAELCPAGSGRNMRLVCPYHQWTYDLSGRLIHAGRMGAGFERDAHGLRPVHVEIVAGVIFVCLADEPPPFAAFRERLEPALAPHRLEDARLACTVTLVEKGNWKLVMENARECYHCATGHPELAFTFPVTTRGNFEAEGNRRILDFNTRLDRAGLPVGPWEGDFWQVARFPLNEGMVSMTMDGKHGVKKLMVETEGGDIGSLRFAIEPHAFSHATADMLFTFSANPTAPNETLVTGKWYVHKDAVEGVDYDPQKLIELWDVTNRQDRDLVELNQRGVNSVGYVPGPYSPEGEILVGLFTDWYRRHASAYANGRAAEIVENRTEHVHGVDASVPPTLSQPDPLPEFATSA